MKTREFNLNNWTGDTAVVSYTVGNRTFDFQGETWTLGRIQHVDGGICIVSLYGNGWDGALMSNVIFETGPGHSDMMHEAVITASRWIANHV